MSKRICTAVVLAAGSGSRMGGQVAKQFLELDGKPLIFYALDTIEKSEIIDQCVLVTSPDKIEYVKQEIVKKYSFTKVKHVIEGGKERYDSVRNAVAILSDEEYIFIHDGARTLLSEGILRRGLEAVEQYQACVAAVPVKDTIKVVDEEGYAIDTPDRRTLWQIQTPQVFRGDIIRSAYAKLPEQDNVTDDASVVEKYGTSKIKMYLGDYTNIKVTTPDDLILMKAFLEQKANQK